LWKLHKSSLDCSVNMKILLFLLAGLLSFATALPGWPSLSTILSKSRSSVGSASYITNLADLRVDDHGKHGPDFERAKQQASTLFNEVTQALEYVTEHMRSYPRLYQEYFGSILPAENIRYVAQTF